MIPDLISAYCLGPLIGLAVNAALALLCLLTRLIYAGYPPLKPLSLFYLVLTGYFLGLTVYELQASSAWTIRGYQLMLVSLAWLPVSWLYLVGVLAGRSWGWVTAAALAAGALCTLLLLSVNHPLVFSPRMLLHLSGRTLRPESVLLRPAIYGLDLAALFFSAGFLLRRGPWGGKPRPAWAWAVLAGLALWLVGGLNDILHALEHPAALDPPVLWIASIWLSLCLAGAVALHLHGLEEAVRRSEEKYRTILSSIQEGYYEVNLNGDMTFFNQALCRVTGYAPAEMRGLNYRAYMDPATAEGVLRAFNQVADSGKSMDSLEWPLTRKDGGRCFVEVSIAPLRDAEGRLTGFRGMARDVTPRKRAERKLLEKQAELHALAKEVIRVQENERRRIAQELHDGVGQYLLAGKLRLEQMLRKAPPELAPEIDLVNSMLKQSLADTRSLTAQLCPPALWELGLEEALAWLAEQARERYGLEIGLEVTAGLGPLDQESRAALFRCASELLLNVAKHAQAKRAMLSLRGEGRAVCLRVWDDGVGMDHAPAEGRAKAGLGLFSIRERMSLLGGGMEVDSRPGQGTRICLRLPTPPPIPPAGEEGA